MRTPTSPPAQDLAPNTTQGVPGLKFKEASIKGTVDIFPQYMVRSIRKVNGKAAIRMFAADKPQGGSILCIMSLTILAERVDAIALDLFGIQLESDGGFRYVHCFRRKLAVSNGFVSFKTTMNRLLLRDGGMCLKGVDQDAIREYLGIEIHDAIEASPIRIEEITKEGMIDTNCVSMEISENPMQDVTLNLNIGLEQASLMQQKLYT